jgi:hypothetical protein
MCTTVHIGFILKFCRSFFFVLFAVLVVHILAMELLVSIRLCLFPSQLKYIIVKTEE